MTKGPPLRLIPPSAAQLALDADAPFVAILPAGPGLEAGLFAPGAARFRAERSDGALRITGTRAALRQLARTLAIAGQAAGELLARALEPPVAWELRGGISLLLDRPHVMGIVNLTEDSFSGDGVGQDAASALRRAEALREAGAAIIDVGAETARADRPVVDPELEAKLVAPVVAALAREGHVVSVDTYKPLVARAALESGAHLVNDISGLTLGTAAAEEAIRAGAGYVLNYSYSVPKRRPDSPPVYEDVVAETVAWMFERQGALFALGMRREQLAIDPGIAFGKSHDEDLQLLRRLGELQALGQPVLLAHSRKNFIGSVTGLPPEARDPETHAASVLAYAQGARIFRLHDAAGAARALAMAHAIVSAPAGAFAPGDESWPWRAGASAAHMTRAAADKAPPPGQRW